MVILSCHLKLEIAFVVAARNKQFSSIGLSVKLHNDGILFYPANISISRIGVPDFRLFQCYRQTVDLLFCTHNCIGLSHGPEPYMSRI